MKKKIFSLLVLLAAAVSGAWAKTISVDFEDNALPQGWTTYGTQPWYVATSGYYSRPGSAYDGNYSSFSKGNNNSGTNKSYLVSPAITFQGAGSVSFAYVTPAWAGDRNKISVAYSESPTGPWTDTSFANKTSDDWTTATVDLSSLNGTYYIAFVCIDYYGYCAGIDNISIDVPSGFALTKDADAEAHGTISFTVGEGGDAVVDATEAEAGDKVTVTITPAADYVPGSTITVQPYGEIKNAMARRNISGQSSIGIAQPFEVPINITETEGGTLFTATFTMPEANAQISVPYLKLLSSDDITIEAIPDQTYTGQAITPTLVVKDGETELVKDVDYTVLYFSNINAGQTTDDNPPVAVITPAEGSEYAGGNVIKFNILPATITDEMIAEIGDKTYTTNPIEPALTITFGEGENAMTLTKGTDFTVEYSNNVNAGVATASVTGQGNFTGEASADFNIVPKALNKNMISPIDDQEYTGEAQEPELDVNFNGKPLVEGTDYTVEYTDNVEAGKATATITGMGNYEGEASANFYVGRVDLNDEDRIKIAYIYWEDYDGAKHTPRVEVRDGLVPLVLDVDYKMTFKDNVEAGTARITFQGLGNYKGKVNKYFAIKSYVLDIDMVQDIADQTWTGEAVTPAISVINGNVTLTQDKDFTVKFKNNVNEGTATAIINGTGNFRSIDLVKTFKIVKKAEVADPEAVDSPGEATAISGPVAGGSPAGTAYDLGGRKAKANRKGVVIIDGKLVLKK